MCSCCAQAAQQVQHHLRSLLHACWLVVAKQCAVVQAGVFPLLAREDMNREAQTLSTQLTAVGIFNMIDTTGAHSCSCLSSLHRSSARPASLWLAAIGIAVSSCKLEQALTPERLQATQSARSMRAQMRSGCHTASRSTRTPSSSETQRCGNETPWHRSRALSAVCCLLLILAECKLRAGEGATRRAAPGAATAHAGRGGLGQRQQAVSSAGSTSKRSRGWRAVVKCCYLVRAMPGHQSVKTLHIAERAQRSTQGGTRPKCGWHPNGTQSLHSAGEIGRMPRHATRCALFTRTWRKRRHVHSGADLELVCRKGKVINVACAAAVEGAIQHLRECPVRSTNKRKDAAAQAINEALATVHDAGYSKVDIQAYLWRSVHYNLKDGTFHSSLHALQTHTSESEVYYSRERAKCFSFAKLLLREI